MVQTVSQQVEAGWRPQRPPQTAALDEKGAGGPWQQRAMLCAAGQLNACT